ncbi:lycopene beta-cyclase [Gordonia araii NBRC 100433]|uniref:Lycopene beta-cyclase n=1 Tax=Gordonia araii NBRC 100433 TaxID=1073574 RepID=G7H5M4_9ACTN|nr:lycopene cyclase family protein [Gordonia araii]NNG95861.1 FAD-binding protein [Gordonia araii NBRC 100433]GAB11149.1 lycopene beta-cyclase [Gordonia araii NBRC 100433]
MASPDSDVRTDLLVVGAGPAGAALAHRAAVAGLAVTLVDRTPQQRWSQTFGAFVDELPAWLSMDCLATRSDEVAVYTPRRRVLDRAYAVLDNSALRRALSLDAVTIVTAEVLRVGRSGAVLADGSTLQAPVVIDASSRRGHPGAPRQRAYGVVGSVDDAETVLMDWRSPLGSGASGAGPLTFGYRVPVDGERLLVEETFLAGDPPPVNDLAGRWELRGTPAGWSRDDAADVEIVDFPLTGPTLDPWADDGPLRFGAAGGLMHPATGYSVATSLRCADIVVDAITSGADPRAALWPSPARRVYRLRELGLGVLLRLGPTATVEFFDAFFGLDPDLQYAYLSSRDDLPGVSAAMRGTFSALGWPGRRRLASTSLAAAMEQIRDSRRWTRHGNH